MVSEMDPTHALVTPPSSGTHARKRITILTTTYTAPHLILPLLCIRRLVIPTDSWRLLCNQAINLKCTTECLSL